MDARLDNSPDDRKIWITRCAHRLRERFPRVALVTLEEVAEQLIDDGRLQGLGPTEAAERWLSFSR